MGSSLISRLAAATALLAAAVIVVAFFAFHAVRGNVFRASFVTPLEEWSVMMGQRIGRDPEIARAAALNHEMGVSIEFDGDTYAFGPDGEAVSQQFLIDEHASDRTILVHGHRGIKYSFFFTQGGITNGNNSALWLLIGGVLFLVGVVYVVQLSQLRPLRWLKEGVDKVSQGDLSTRVPVIRMDEIGQVGKAFNHMTERVEQMLDDHDRLMADVSHELRSPMARIKVALELLPEGDKRDAIAKDIREMEALTTVLLERERIKNRAALPKNDFFDLVALTRDVVSGFEGRTPSIVISSSPDVLQVQADEALVKILLQNLIDNAVKFSPADSGPVDVQLSEDGDMVAIVIADDGPGIPAEMSERVLEPFVKLDPARGHRSGYGLGLNLCDRIVKAHSGSIRLEPRQPRGTSVRVEIRIGDTSTA